VALAELRTNRLHEQCCLDGTSSSSRTSSSFLVLPYKSNESRTGVGEDLTEIEEAEDLEEWPRDHNDDEGDVTDEVEDVRVW